MKCELCQKSDASVHLKEVLNGDKKDLFVCKECAVKNGFDSNSPLSLVDFLFGVGLQRSQQAPVQSSCEMCGLTRAEFNKRRRFGCPECYRTFSAEVEECIAEMQRGIKHTGKVPAVSRRTREIAVLEKSLKNAVVVEDFERAAELRDSIRDMQDDVAASSVRDGGGQQELELD